MKRVLVTLATLVFGVCSHVEARSYDDIVASGYIEIAVYRDFPPYSYHKDNQAVGIDIEIGKLIAAELNVMPRWMWITADENLEDDLRNAIWKGHVLDPDKKVADVMLRVPYDRSFSHAIDGYGLPKNEMVHMLAPYHRESWAIARDLKKTGTVRNLAIFQYEKVGVEIDSLPDFFLGTTLRGRLRDNIVHFPNVYAGLDSLANGEISAIAGMRSQIEWGMRESSAQFDVSGDGLETMSKRAWDIGIAIKNDHRQLGYAVEAVVESRVADGSIDSIFKRYRLSFRIPSLYQLSANQ